MSKSPEKDFGPIADDYAFFERHATEAEQDARAYLQCLKDSMPIEGPVRMLDFGCGSGTFTARFLAQALWPPQELHLTLIEPVESARRQAALRLADFTTSPVAASALLSDEFAGSFDVILANHVLYYVPNLETQLARLIEALSAPGVFITAIAQRTNALIDLWIAGFRLLEKDIPYHTSEDVEKALNTLEASYEKQSVPYELTFPDTEENRKRIIHFLLADFLEQMPLDPLLNWFDQYQSSGQIQIRTACDHYAIRPK